jgi:hypothetical protein
VMKMPPTVKPAVSWARDPGLSSVRGAIIIKMRSVIDSASRTALSCLCNAGERARTYVCVCLKWRVGVCVRNRGIHDFILGMCMYMGREVGMRVRG